MDKTIFECKKYVTNSLFIKKAVELNLTLEEFLMLTYFDSDYNNYLDMNLVSNNLGIPLSSCYEVFNKLVSKKLLTISSDKDLEGRMIEKVNLDNFYDLIVVENVKEQKEQEKNDIYGIFEHEFGRTLSGMEYEIIKAWMTEKNYSEELILGALKEAIYNGVNNLRYIDKILFEWNKKGFKNMQDVNNHLENKKEKKEKREELFDYNWLDDIDD